MGGRGGGGADMHLDMERATGGGGGGRRWRAAPRKRPPPARVGSTSVRGVMEDWGEALRSRMGGRGGAGANMHLGMGRGTVATVKGRPVPKDGPIVGTMYAS